MMEPFDSYPGGGRALLGVPRDSANCRHGYGLELQQVTRQTGCAYCGMSLVDTYEHWLLMSVDHVVPRGQAAILGVPAAFREDVINLVVCCAGCNGFGNRFAIPTAIGVARESWDIESFLSLRDAVFRARASAITERCALELAAYMRRRWEDAPRPRPPVMPLVAAAQ